MWSVIASGPVKCVVVDTLDGFIVIFGAGGVYSTAMGAGANIGSAAQSTGNFSVAVGGGDGATINGAQTTGNFAAAVGSGSRASGDFASAFGVGAHAVTTATAVGNAANASGGTAISNDASVAGRTQSSATQNGYVAAAHIR